MQIVCYRDLHWHDYLPQEQVCEMNCLYRTEPVCEMNFLYRTELVCEMNCLYRTELVCCDGVAEVVLQQPGVESQQPERVLLHTLVVAGKVYNPDCRKRYLHLLDYFRD